MYQLYFKLMRKVNDTKVPEEFKMISDDCPDTAYIKQIARVLENADGCIYSDVQLIRAEKIA